MGVFDGILPTSAAGQDIAGVDKPGLAERWKGWMSKPENAALLMQTGIAMLQPLQPGQGTLGAIGSAIGQGFEAKDRVVQGANDQALQAEDQQLKRQKVANDQQRLADDLANSKSDRSYKKQLGLSSLLSTSRSRAAGKVPPTQQEQYQKFYQTMVIENQKAIQPMDASSPEFKQQVQNAWTASRSMPGVDASAGEVGALPSKAPPSAGMDPVPTGLQAKVAAARAAGATPEQIKQFLLNDGFNPQVIQQLGL